MKWLRERFGEDATWGAIGSALLALAIFVPMSGTVQTIVLIGAGVCWLLAFGLPQKFTRRL